MLKRIPGFVLWAFLAVAVALVPLACGSDDGGNNDGAPKDMTSG